MDSRFLECNGEPEIQENFDRIGALIGFGTAINAVAATGSLTIATNPTANDTMTIGTKVYTFKAAAAADGDIAIGAAAADTQANIKAAINGTGAGQVCTAHPLVTCGTFSANAAAITAITKGVAGNAIAATETFTAVGNVFGAAKMSGGVDGTVGVKGAILVDADKIHVATDDNTIADANWKYASLT